MSRKARELSVLGAGSAALVLLCAAAALAASPFTPKLGSPNGKHVNGGAITLTVKAPSGKSVFAWVRPKRVLKHGELAQCTSSGNGCAVVQMKPWKGHRGWWRYQAPAYQFSGYWAATAGKYYWQARAFAKTPPCVLVKDGICSFYSTIGHFNVR